MKKKKTIKQSVADRKRQLNADDEQRRRTQQDDDDRRRRSDDDFTSMNSTLNMLNSVDSSPSIPDSTPSYDPPSSDFGGGGGFDGGGSSDTI